MSCTRRSFLKMVSAGVACLTLGQLGFALEKAKAYVSSLKIEGAKEVVTVCPFCAVCCQVVAYVRDNKLVSTEGDPDSPSMKARFALRAHRSLPCTPVIIVLLSPFTVLLTAQHG